jgi:hypothetical protein
MTQSSRAEAELETQDEDITSSDISLWRFSEFTRLDEFMETVS